MFLVGIAAREVGLGLGDEPVEGPDVARRGADALFLRGAAGRDEGDEKKGESEAKAHCGVLAIRVGDRRRCGP